MSHISNLTALKDLYDQKFNNLVIYAVNMGIPYEQAKDIVQECFIKLWEKHHHISSPTSYLFSAVRNNSIKYIVSKKNSPDKKLQLSAVNSQPFDDSSIEEAIEYFQKVEALYKRIQGLGGRYMDIFVMVYLNKMKIKDVADEMGISENTVKTYLRRGKDFLRILVVCIASTLLFI